MVGVCISKVLLPYRPECSQNGAKCIDNIVQPSMRSRSRSEMVNGSGQGTSRCMKLRYCRGLGFKESELNALSKHCSAKPAK